MLMLHCIIIIKFFLHVRDLGHILCSNSCLVFAFFGKYRALFAVRRKSSTHILYVVHSVCSIHKRWLNDNNNKWDITFMVCPLDQLEKGLPAPHVVPPQSCSGVTLGSQTFENPTAAPCSPCGRNPLPWRLLKVGFSTLWNTALQIVTYTRSAFTGNLSLFVSSFVAFILTFIVPQTCLWCLRSCSYKGFFSSTLKAPCSVLCL